MRGVDGVDELTVEIRASGVDGVESTREVGVSGVNYSFDNVT